MFIDKIFHLRQPLAEARRRLREAETWRGLENDAEVRCWIMEREGIGRFEFGTRQGTRVLTDIKALPGEDPNRLVFRSVRGNVELTGMIELYPIRPNLTEVVLTLDYETGGGALQMAFEAVDRFLNRQLARLEDCAKRQRD